MDEVTFCEKCSGRLRAVEGGTRHNPLRFCPESICEKFRIVLWGWKID